VKRPVAYFAGTGRAAPATVLTNHDFASRGIETTHEWIVERTGIHERRIAAEGETTASIAADASRCAMQRAGITAGDIDAIVLSTATADRLLPSTAVDLQAILGATRAAAFDISAGVHGLALRPHGRRGAHRDARRRDRARGRRRKDERHRRLDRPRDVRALRRRRGRGRAEAEPRAAPHPRPHAEGDPLDVHAFRRQPRGAALAPGGGTTLPFSEAMLSDHSHFVKMAGREVFKHAVRSMSEAADRALDGARLTGADVDLLIPHQANVRIIEATAKHANIPMDKVYVNVDRYGNTSSASIGIALDEAIESGRVKEGSTVLLVAFGAGFTWGSMLVRF
jgi:3-oxoacyl-[acyl-carrier-protein] synthase-3